ncbi:MAG TPA: cytochrome c3 family protein [Terriglobales bacterium]|nr:cytochrome c3 family protein [Terriglobales bacterium]
MKRPKFIPVLLLLAFSIRAWPGEHPVPLEANVDAAKCLECHEDKSKGKNVHTAISMGCTACHEVKTEKDVTTVNLNQPKDQLCFTCHAKTAKESDTQHGPYDKGQCLTCHDPHVSDYAKQLRADLNASFCLECHSSRKDVPEKVAIFKSQEMSRDDFQQIPKLYLSFDLRSGHPIDKHPTLGVPNPMKPTEKLTCTSCHATHTSTQAKLLPELDKEGRDICTQCHLVVDTAKEEQALAEGKVIDAKRMEELKKKNPDAGKPTPKSRGDGQ